MPCALSRIKVQAFYDIGHGILIIRPSFTIYISFTEREILVDAADEHLSLAVSWMIGVGFIANTIFMGGLPIHGAGACLDEHYFALVALSGTGKSTTLWTLLKTGALFGNDDMLPVRLESNVPIAYPSASLYPKLDRSVLERDELDWTPYQAVESEANKVWVPVPSDQRIIEPQPLSAIFLLQPIQTQANQVCVSRKSLADAMKIICLNLHGLSMLERYMNAARLAAFTETLAQVIPVYTLHYQKQFEVLPKLVEAIRATLNCPIQAEAIF